MRGWNKMENFLFSTAEKSLEINSKLEMTIWAFLLAPITALSLDSKRLIEMTERYCYFIHNKCQNFSVNFHFLCAGGFKTYKIWLTLAVIPFIEDRLHSRPCLGFVPMFSIKPCNHTMRQVFLTIKLQVGGAACPRSHDRYTARLKSWLCIWRAQKMVERMASEYLKEASLG